MHILLVEDDPAAARLVIEAFHEVGGETSLTVAGDGREALAVLRRAAPHQAAPRPDLVLLDLNIPIVSGHEVLAAVKSDPALLQIPVAIFSTSDAPEDIARAYALHANCYLAKPRNFAALVRLVAAVLAFWRDTATLPPPAVEGGRP